MTNSKSFDAIIIGAGLAGPSLVSILPTPAGVAIVERNLFGGTCVNTGCIPTKTPIESARVAHMTPNCTVFTSHSRFLSGHEVQLDDVVLTAKNVFINVGGRYVAIEFARMYRRFGSQVTILQHGPLSR